MKGARSYHRALNASSLCLTSTRREPSIASLRSNVAAPFVGAHTDGEESSQKEDCKEGSEEGDEEDGQEEGRPLLASASR